MDTVTTEATRTESLSRGVYTYFSDKRRRGMYGLRLDVDKGEGGWEARLKYVIPL